MAEENSFVYGIIHIGSSSLSMRIVEYKDADTIRVIEEVRKETTFGEEVHKRGEENVLKNLQAGHSLGFHWSSIFLLYI